jgi:hypothetical protein
MPMEVTTMNQVRSAWTGFVGGPGISTMYFDGAAVPPVAAVRTFFNAVISSIPSVVQIQVPAAGQGISATDGTLEGSWSVGTPPAIVTGTGSGAYMSAQGVEIVWNTDEIADGRAIKGRTFLVPMSGSAFGSDGLVSSTYAATVTSAAGTLLAGTPKMAVWHRPKRGPRPSGGGPAPIVRPGSWAKVTSCTVPRKVVVLTSRRD